MRSYQRYPHGSSAILAQPQQTTSPRIFPNARQIATTSAGHAPSSARVFLGYFLGLTRPSPNHPQKHHAA